MKQKILFISLLAILFLTFSVFGSVEVTVLRCYGEPLGSPSYELTNISNDLGQDDFYLKLVPNNPTAKKTVVRIGNARTSLKAYSDTIIFYSDRGKSGYVLFYSKKDKTSLIDINLFGEGSQLNTNGPITNYKCNDVFAQ